MLDISHDPWLSRHGLADFLESKHDPTLLAASRAPLPYDASAENKDCLRLCDLSETPRRQQNFAMGRSWEKIIKKKKVKNQVIDDMRALVFVLSFCSSYGCQWQEYFGLNRS